MMTWYEIKKKVDAFTKNDVLIYDDVVETEGRSKGNQQISLMYKRLFQFKITRPQMNKLKKLGYKVKRRKL
jgi:hypothetical protein